MESRRFTLVELMIAVAIISVLAAIAIPLMTEYQLKAKQGEAYVNGDSLVTQTTLAASGPDSYGIDASSGWNTGFSPREWYQVSAPGAGKALPAWSWPGPYGDGAKWAQLGWAPDGAVRCIYMVNFQANANVSVAVACDLDGDTHGPIWEAAIVPGSSSVACVWGDGVDIADYQVTDAPSTPRIWQAALPCW